MAAGIMLPTRTRGPKQRQDARKSEQGVDQAIEVPQGQQRDTPSRQAAT